MKFVFPDGTNYIPNKFLTFRDILLVPQFSEVTSRNDKNINLKTYIAKNFEIDVPIITANMDTVTEADMVISMNKYGAFGILHRFYEDEKSLLSDVEKVISKTGKIAFSVGINNNFDLVKNIIDIAGDKPKLMCVDVAHGHLKIALDAVEKWKNKFPSVSVLAGNIATKQGAIDVVNAGADGLKVGIGSGSICSTRIVTGHGIPMITAIMNVRDAIGDDIPIVADGGIRSSGDIVKALAAGANSIMCGKLFAATEESPGEVIITSEGKRCQYRGQSSKSFLDDVGKSDVTPEGIRVDMPYKGRAEDMIKDMIGGIKSGLSYSGVFNLEELRDKSQAIEISHQGWIESTTHVINDMR